MIYFYILCKLRWRHGQVPLSQIFPSSPGSGEFAIYFYGLLGSLNLVPTLLSSYTRHETASGFLPY